MKAWSLAGSGSSVPKAEGTPIVEAKAAATARPGVCAVMWFEGPELAP